MQNLSIVSLLFVHKTTKDDRIFKYILVAKLVKIEKRITVESSESA